MNLPSRPRRPQRGEFPRFPVLHVGSGHQFGPAPCHPDQDRGTGPATEPKLLPATATSLWPRRPPQRRRPPHAARSSVEPGRWAGLQELLVAWKPSPNPKEMDGTHQIPAISDVKNHFLPYWNNHCLGFQDSLNTEGYLPSTSCPGALE